MAATKIKRGATIKGKINLRSKPDQNSASEFPYVIPVGAVIELKFPGETSTVVLSTANAGEITVIDPDASQISFVMSAAKSALLEVNATAAVDCVVTDASISPENVDIFEQTKVFNIEDPANI